LAILEDVLARVPIREAQIENALAGIENARAARACAETMHEPRKSLERCEFEDLQATDGAQRPR